MNPIRRTTKFDSHPLTRGPWLLAATVLAALIIAPFAVAQATGGGIPILGGKRSPSANTSQAFSSETQIIANNSTYGTRQSNKSDNGGGAIYGCRSKPGGSEKGNEACVRAVNLAGGRAFEFHSAKGGEVGRITSADAAAAPFTTNATGVATGLNADKVDGMDADQVSGAAQTAVKASLPFALVAADGTLSASSRGVTSSARTAAGSYKVVFAADVSGCALSATQQSADAGASGVVLDADKKTVEVVTRSGGGDDGTAPTAPTDRAFHLTATC